MFIGHFAMGLAASRAEKRLPLGTPLAMSMVILVPILRWCGNKVGGREARA